MQQSPYRNLQPFNYYFNDNPNYDTVLSVCDSTGGFQCGGYCWEDTGNDHFFRTSTYYACRQDSPKRYKENGALYVITATVLSECKKKIGGQVGAYVMPRHRSFEIDYLDEFEELDLLLKSGFIDSMNEKGSVN